MRVLITGGAGFIGTNFVKNAIEKNHMIYNVDNLSLYPKDQNQFHKNYTFSKIHDYLVINNFMNIIIHH